MGQCVRHIVYAEWILQTTMVWISSRLVTCHTPWKRLKTARTLSHEEVHHLSGNVSTARFLDMFAHRYSASTPPVKVTSLQEKAASCMSLFQLPSICRVNLHRPSMHKHTITLEIATFVSPRIRVAKRGLRELAGLSDHHIRLECCRSPRITGTLKYARRTNTPTNAWPYAPVR